MKKSKAIVILIVILGALAGLAYYASIILSSTGIGEEMSIPCLLYTSLCGGFLMGKRMREQKFLWGMAAGIIYFLLLFGVSLLVKGTGDLQMTRIFSTLILCGASGLSLIHI